MSSARDQAEGSRRRGAATPRVVLELYIAGTMPHSVQAVSDVKGLCEHFFKGRYVLRVFDLHRDPQLAAARQILALPTLIRVEPGPIRRLLGGFADTQRVLSALGLPHGSDIV